MYAERPPRALRRTFELETLARRFIYASRLGEPHSLPDDEIERVAQKMSLYGTADASDAEFVRVSDASLAAYALG